MRTRLTALLLVGALAVAACGGATGGSSSAEAAASQTGEGFEGEFPTLDGGSVDLAEFEGQDVVLWFWAPW